MTKGFQIHHPMLFLMPIMLLSVGGQAFTWRRRQRGLAAPEWVKTASVVILLLFCFVGVFAEFQ